MNKCSFVISTIYKVILFLVNLKVFFAFLLQKQYFCHRFTGMWKIHAGAETEKEIQNNMEILLKHQVGYEKNFHTEEEWETLINKYRNTRTLTKEMVNAFVEKIEIHESGSITVRLVYDDMLEELRKYAKEREAESCQ